MKLVIVSHTPHYRKNGQIVGWGATVREINYLAKLFKEVIHIAPIHQEAAPIGSLAYETPSIVFKPVPPSVGDGFFHYLDLLLRMPIYAGRILAELKQADVVHVRCPAAISLIACFLLFFVRKPRIRWIKYAGNWRPEAKEPWSYAFQRWWLEKNLARSIVTVNGEWPNQPKHIHSFLNPCLTVEEIKETKIPGKDKKLVQPLQLLFVGRLETEKGVHRCLEIAAGLSRKGFTYQFDFVGDGPDREKFKKIASGLILSEQVHFQGWLSRKALDSFYAKAHFLILPSQTEGWPKVISESMAYGVIPLVSATGCIPQYLSKWGVGRAFNPDQPEDFVEAISGYFLDPGRWRTEVSAAVQCADQFSYENYLKAVEQLLFKKSSL